MSSHHYPYAEFPGCDRGREGPLTVRGVMTSVRFDRMTRLGIGACLVFLFQAPGMSRSAWAGCNHLVSSHLDRTLHFRQLDDLITGDLSIVDSDDMARGPLGEPGPERSWPCSGPGCSNRVPTPVPTAFPDFERADRWATSSHLAIPLIGSPWRRTVDEPDARPIAKSPRSSILPPPEASYCHRPRRGPESGAT